jgi:hypothetical protein
MISRKMRDVLIDHLDGREVPIIHATEASGMEARDLALKQHTTSALLHRRLLKIDGKLPPRTTTITESGRSELCRALADWADALARADDRADWFVTGATAAHNRPDVTVDASLAPKVPT